MEVRLRTEDKEGNVVFEGTLSGKELDFVVGVGVNYLLAQGAMPYVKKDPSEVEGNDTVQ